MRQQRIEDELRRVEHGDGVVGFWGNPHEALALNALELTGDGHGARRPVDIGPAQTERLAAPEAQAECDYVQRLFPLAPDFRKEADGFFRCVGSHFWSLRARRSRLVCHVALHELIVHGLVERLVEDRVHVLDRALAETARGALAVQASHISGLQLGQLELADALDDVIVNITLVAGPGARSQVGLLVGDQSVKNVATLTERGGSTGWLWAKA